MGKWLCTMCGERTSRLCIGLLGGLVGGESPCRSHKITVQLEPPLVPDGGSFMLIASRKRRSSPLRLLTKGDNNAADDTELYARGQSFLNRQKDVIGSVVGYIPFVGYVTILLSEYPWLKTVMLGLMGLTVVLQRE